MVILYVNYVYETGPSCALKRLAQSNEKYFIYQFSLLNQLYTIYTYTCFEIENDGN